MRIVCPGSTSQLLLGGRAGPSTNTRLTQQKREVKKTQVEDAKKKFDKKKQVNTRMEAQGKLKSAINFVYVGNLETFITPARLEDMFGQCGSIIRTIIRCSRGEAVTVALPEGETSPRDRQYATIEFHDPRSAKEALRYHGVILDGCQLVVTYSPADLPEVVDIVETRLKSIRERQGWPLPRNPCAPKPLIAHDTERFVDYRQPTADRHHLFGFSFAKCIT